MMEKTKSEKHEYDQGPLTCPSDTFYLTNLDYDHQELSNFEYHSGANYKRPSDEHQVYHPHSSMLVIPEDFTTAPAAFGAYENFYQNDPYYDYPYREYYDPENSFQSEYGDHVNPAMVESGMSFGYSGESSQTVMDESRQTKPRQQGQPTNIVPTAKMDRKTLKRLRNRVSASRCRVKKKEWISEMEEDSMHLHEENNFLLKKIAQLEDAVRRAKQMLEYYPPHS